ncbi:molecular chaperone Hsp33, partial [Staphylococcus sp. MB371]
MTKVYLVRGLAFNDEVRAFAVQTTIKVQEAQTRHDPWPTAAASFGRPMTAGVSVGSTSNSE